jgi:DNA-binding NarL/FixJ family response regulator
MSYALESATCPLNIAGSADLCTHSTADRQAASPSAGVTCEPAPDWFVPKIWQLCLDWMARDIDAAGAGLLFFGLPPAAPSGTGGKGRVKTAGNENVKVWATVGDTALPWQIWLQDHGSRPAWPTCMRRISLCQWVVCETQHGPIDAAVRPSDSSSLVVGAKLAHGASMVVYAGFQSRPGEATALAQRALLGGAALAAAAQSLVRVRDQGQEAQWARESRHTQIAHLVKMHSLTEAESHILHQLISGTPYRDIARKRTVTLSTVKSQIKSIYGKLGVHRAGQIYGLL